MDWTALIPFKPAGQRKTRLAARFSRDERDRLSEHMLFTVASALSQSRHVSSMILLSEAEPDGWRGRWMRDRGQGLNRELMMARGALDAEPLLIIHADLPLIRVEDVDTLLGAAASSGCALAPDRHRLGTNALAIADGRAFDFKFGLQSFQLHRHQAHTEIGVVERRGLTLDIDTEDDLHAAVADGFVFDL